MKNVYKAIALALAITGATGTATTFAAVNGKEVMVESRAAAVQSGWHYNGHVWRYWKNGEVVTGWVKDAGKWYYLSLDDGAMVTYPTEINGNVYVFRADGSLVEKGWVKSLNQWYYVDQETQAAVRGQFKNVNGINYYLNEDGVMLTGAQRIGGKLYVFRETGSRVDAGWYKTGGNWYHVNNFHHNAKENQWHQELNGTWYYLGEDGKMLANTTFKDPRDNEIYVFNGNGAMLKNGWHKVNGNWYFTNKSGVVQTGWLFNNNKWYYLEGEEQGKMVSGAWKEINGVYYFFDTSGAMQ